MTLGEFRQNVQDQFARGLEVIFVPGLLEGPNQSGDWLGSCYLSRVSEDPARVDEVQIFVTIRVFAPYSQEGSRSPNVPFDPAPLEEVSEKIFAVIAANQTGLGAWFQRITSIEIDPVRQGVQAILMAYDRNPGTVPLEA